MSWRVITITPPRIGMPYYAVVYKPENFVLATRTFNATGGLDDKDLPYRAVAAGTPGSEEAVDLWYLGITYTGRKPRRIDVRVMEGGTERDIDKPTVADGTGGGSTRKKRIKTRVLSIKKSSRLVRT